MGSDVKIYGFTAENSLGKKTGTLEEFARAGSNDNTKGYIVFPANYFNAYESTREVFGGIYSQGEIVFDSWMNWGCGFDKNNKFYMFCLVSTISNEGGTITITDGENKVEIVTAFNCYPWLIKDGVNLEIAPIPGADESFLNAKNQRAFMGQTANGEFMYGMVSGVTVKELQGVCADLGLVNAVNTDGGASCGVYRDGRYLAKPGRELASVVFIGIEDVPVEPEIPTYIAVPTQSTMFIDGVSTIFESYNINDNNYFKLRDLAFAVSGTKKQFAVDYNEAEQAVMLTSGQPYVSVGGEPVQGDGTIKNAAPTSSVFQKDGVNVEAAAYLIGDNNFVKLRDIMALFDIGVTYDETTQNIEIDTLKPYTN